jgi:hypothetical protein
MPAAARAAWAAAIWGAVGAPAKTRSWRLTMAGPRTVTDTQAIILSAASQRAGAIALPLPDSLKGGAAQKVVGAMLAKGLIEEIEAGRGEPVWRETDDGYGVTRIATSAGLAAIGVEPEALTRDAPDTARGAPDAAEDAGRDATPPVADTPPADAPLATEAPKARRTREGTKQAQLIAMLRAEGGATIDEIVAALDWRPHTVRGALAGALKRKLGLTIASEKVDGRGRAYHIAD